MSRIACSDDLPHIESSIKASQAHSDTEKKELVNTIREIVNHTLLRPFFVKNLESYNERELLDIDGKIHRPDRLVFKEKTVTIIDYKTGGHTKSNETQINGYAKILEEMGFEVENKILVYIADKITTLFV